MVCRKCTTPSDTRRRSPVNLPPGPEGRRSSENRPLGGFTGRDQFAILTCLPRAGLSAPTGVSLVMVEPR
jgi:hypothetical protein